MPPFCHSQARAGREAIGSSELAAAPYYATDHFAHDDEDDDDDDDNDDDDEDDEDEERIHRHLGSRERLSPTLTVGVDACRPRGGRLPPRTIRPHGPTPVARFGQRHVEREAC